MKKTYITPDTQVYKIELTTVIAASPGNLQVKSGELGSSDAQFSRRASVWDDDEDEY